MTTTSRRSTATKSKKSGSTAKKTAAPAHTAIYQKAIGEYEIALKAFSKKDFDKSGSLLEKLIEAFPTEREVCDRARIYLRLSLAQSEGGGPKPKESDDHYYLGVLEANNGDFDGAVGHFERAVKQDGRNDKAHYALAAALGLKGDAAGAAASLKTAIDLKSANRTLALNDADFDGLRDNAEFMALLGKPPEGAV